MYTSLYFYIFIVCVNATTSVNQDSPFFRFDFQATVQFRRVRQYRRLVVVVDLDVRSGGHEKCGVNSQIRQFRQIRQIREFREFRQFLRLNDNYLLLIT